MIYLMFKFPRYSVGDGSYLELARHRAPTRQHRARQQFCAMLKAALAVVQEQSFPVLIMIDVVGLTTIGAQLGDDAELALCAAAARRTAEAIGASGFVAGLRHSRIAALVASDAVASVDALCTRVIAEFAHPLVAGDLSLALGVALATPQWRWDGATVEELFVVADRRMQGVFQPAYPVETRSMDSARCNVSRQTFRPSPLAA